MLKNVNYLEELLNLLARESWKIASSISNVYRSILKVILDMKVFVEEQKMNQLWIFIIFSIGLMVAFLPIFKEWNFIKHQQIGEQIGSFLGPIIVILVFIFIRKISLKTKINKDGIFYQFLPIHFSFKKISWNEIEHISIRKYNAIAEYGGWGLKYGIFTNRGMSITTNGDIGLQLELKNGKKILIGTNRPEQLKQVLETYQNKLNQSNNGQEKSICT